MKEKGHTIVFSTHNMSSVEEICDDIALINHSKVVLDGDVASVRSKFKTGMFDLETLPGAPLVQFNGIEIVDMVDKADKWE